jgi:hypothetical protein
MTRTTNKPGPGEYRITILSHALIRFPCHNNERPGDFDTLDEVAQETVAFMRRQAKVEELAAERDKRRQARGYL